jgi:hypothetical protein
LPQNRPAGPKIYQHLPLQNPPKIVQIGIFGLNIYHLATLPMTTATKGIDASDNLEVLKIKLIFEIVFRISTDF